jgi:Microtubule-binding protein MIP-T3 CH-like domain
MTKHARGIFILHQPSHKVTHPLIRNSQFSCTGQLLLNSILWNGAASQLGFALNFMAEAELPVATAAARVELSATIVHDVSLLTDRVLARPPFAFICWLFDCAKAATGFGAGLFTEEEMLPSTLADKRGRLSYLVKV